MRPTALAKGSTKWVAADRIRPDCSLTKSYPRKFIHDFIFDNFWCWLFRGMCAARWRRRARSRCVACLNCSTILCLSYVYKCYNYNDLAWKKGWYILIRTTCLNVLLFQTIEEHFFYANFNCNRIKYDGARVIKHTQCQRETFNFDEGRERTKNTHSELTITLLSNIIQPTLAGSFFIRRTPR